MLIGHHVRLYHSDRLFHKKIRHCTCYFEGIYDVFIFYNKLGTKIIFWYWPQNIVFHFLLLNELRTSETIERCCYLYNKMSPYNIAWFLFVFFFFFQNVRERLLNSDGFGFRAPYKYDWIFVLVHPVVLKLCVNTKKIIHSQSFLSFNIYPF